MSGDIFGCFKLEGGRGAPRVWWVEARDAANHSAGHRAPRNGTSAVLRLRSLDLRSQCPVSFALKRAEPSHPRENCCVQVSVCREAEV